MAAALGLDYALGVRADLPVAGRKIREVMSITFQEEAAALKPI